MSPPQGMGYGESWLSYLNEVDEMVVLVMGTDGGEELFEWSLLSDGELPACHVKPGLGQLLEEGILGLVILPVGLMGTCLNMDICFPGPDDRCVFLDVVHLGHSEGVVLGVGVEVTGESDIVHCRYWCLVHLLNEVIDWCVGVSFDMTRVVVSSGDVNSLHHLPGFLGDEGEVWIPTFLWLVIDDDDVHNGNNVLKTLCLRYGSILLLQS